jgi:hypothetical protein
MVRSAHLFHFSIGAIIFICAGCSITSHYGADPPDWDYKCPKIVTESDREYCHEYAYQEASHVMHDVAGSDAFSNTAIMLGPFGVLGAAAYVSEQEDDVYEEAMKECLREKGYDLD